jgi:hypothetical protein
MIDIYNHPTKKVTVLCHTSLDKRIKLVSNLVKNINLGGCGVFALELWRILKQEQGIDCDILYTGFGLGLDLVVNHIYLGIKMGSEYYYVDSKGVELADGPVSMRMGVEELRLLVADKERWNKAFHYYFMDQYYNVVSNEDYLVRQMQNYIIDH